MSRYIKDYVWSKYVEARMSGFGPVFQVSMSTAAEVEQAVAELHDIDKNKAIRAGLRSAGGYLSRQGKKRLRERAYTKNGRLTRQGKKDLAAHNLFNAFVVRVKRHSLGALVGFNHRGYHAHLVDRGTQKRPHPITGSSGIMPANYFWSDTASQEYSTAIDMMKETISRAVTRIMTRNNNY